MDSQKNRFLGRHRVAPAACAAVTAAALAVFAVPVAHAQSIISIDFGASGTGGTGVLTSTEFAGPTASDSPLGFSLNVTNWNIAAGLTGTANNLVLSTMSAGTPTATAASVTWSATVQGSTLNPAVPSSGDGDMFKGYLDYGSSASPTVTVTGLPTSFTTYGYTVYVYGDGNNGNANREYTYSLTGATVPTQYLNDPGTTGSNGVGTSFSGTYILGSATPLASTAAITAATYSNFLAFSGLSASTFTLTAAPNLAGTRAPINGIQIVANAAPEPTSVLLLLPAVAGTALAAARRRRRDS